MYLQVQECKLWVQVARPAGHPHSTKDERWVLLMHGFPDSAEMWHHQITALTAAGFSVLAPDMPGFGKSAFTQQDVKQYRLRHIVPVMCGLLDALDISSAAVVGHDWGAAVAWTLALLAPERCSKLIVLSVGHPGAGAAVDPRQRAHWWYQLFFCLPGAEAALVAHDWALMRQILGADGSSADQVEQYVHTLSQPGALTSALNWYRANTHTSHFGATSPLPAALIPRIAVPVLGVWSTADPALLEPQMVASEAYVAPGCWSYVRLEGAGHWIARDAPHQLNELLLGFLAPQATGAAGAAGGGDGVGSGSRSEGNKLLRSRL